MEFRPDINKLMRLYSYTLLTVTLVLVLATLILQVLVVNLDPEVNNQEFVKYVWSWVAGSLIALWISLPGLWYLWIVNLRYSIDDERLVINKGILTKTTISIPYRAITDFTLSRSLYERWLDIATIMVQTAGQGAQAGTHEGKLSGLVDFESLHATLRSRVKAFRGGQSNEKVPDSAAAPINIDVLNSILEEIKKINHKIN